jgi:hypothetical protein
LSANPVEAALCIVEAPCDVELTEQPFGKRWGQQVITLGPEHLAALQSGKLVALDVQGEYVVFVKLGAGE